MSNTGMALTDGYGRGLRYLRLSVTDRCNLKCVYCVNTRRQRFIEHERIMRYEHFLRLGELFYNLGVRKVRITGGEPLARKGLPEFLANFRTRLPDVKLAITTNGVLLPDCLDELAGLGLSSFNISLDSFDADSYRQLTGYDGLSIVLACVDRLLALGQTVKLNAVAVKGVTDAQMESFIYAVKQMPVDLRFIEYMPMGKNTAWSDAMYVSAADLRTLAGQYARLEPVARDDDLAGPANMFGVEGAKGRIGFISALSNHFCLSCQRLRITSEGNLRGCLFADAEARLAPVLRNPKLNDGHLIRIIKAVYARKPLGAQLLNASNRAVAHKQMVGIGG